MNATSSWAQGLLPLVPAAYKPLLQTLAANLTANIQAILAAVGNVYTPTPSGALGLARLEQVQPLYGSTKAYLCCDVPGLGAQLWTALTVLGWLGLGLAVAGLLILGQLDQTHESGACCSCACLRPTKLPPAGKLVNVDAPGGPVATAAALRSRQYVQEQLWLRQSMGDAVVEVRVAAGAGNGASGEAGGGSLIGDGGGAGVRSWVELTPEARPPAQQEMVAVARQSDTLPAVVAP